MILPNFMEVNGTYGACTFIYRGMKSVKYPLIPKFRYRKVGKFIPRHISRRITNQGGLFTIHLKPYEPFESDDMEKLIIPNRIRSMLKRTLNKYGVDRFSLFPSLDGLAAHIEWLQMRREAESG